MANINNPVGAKIIKSLFSDSITQNKYVTSLSDSTPLYLGDFVKTTGLSDDDGNTICTKASETGAIRGIVVGFEPTLDTLNDVYRLANEERTVIVCDDPYILIEIQVSGTLTTAHFGRNANIISGVPNNITGTSGTQVNLSTITTDTAQLKIYALNERVDNSLGQYAKVVCMIHQHELQHAGASTDAVSFIDLSDTPSSYTTENAIYNVNSSKDGVNETTTTLTEPADNQFTFSRGTSSFNVQTSSTIDQNLSKSSSVEFNSAKLSSLNVNNGIVKTDSNGNLSSSTSLPDGTTSTTQALHDSSTKIATTAFVMGEIGVENLWDRDTTGTPFIKPYFTGDNVNIGTGSYTGAGLTLTGFSGVLKASAGVISGGSTTTDVPEGVNLYYTDVRARTSISSSATGLSYDNTTGIFTLTTGYVIPTTAEESNWNDAYNKRVDTWGDGLTYSAQTASVDYNTTNLQITAAQLNTIQNINSTAEPTFKDLILTDFDSAETISEILDETINAGVLHDFTVSDAGGLNISWSSSELYGTDGIIYAINAGSGSVTDNSVNYLKWTSGTSLIISTTSAGSDEILVAIIFSQDGDIWGGINKISQLNTRYRDTIFALIDILPAVVTSGFVVSADPDVTNVWDVQMSVGTYYEEALVKHTNASTIYSRITPMVRWYHSGGVWTHDTNAQIDTTKWDNGTGLVAVNPAKYYRSLFFIVEDVIHWVYPQVEYNTVSEAKAGSCPTKPTGLQFYPNSTCVIIQGNDVAFPAAGSDKWIDARPMIGATGSGSSIQDHRNLSQLTTGDSGHTQFALLAGRSGGQILIGGTVSGDDLTFQTTSNVTKGSYIFSELTTANGIMRVDGSGVVTATTGLPDGTTATTQAAGDNTTKIATTAFVTNAIGSENLWDRVAGTPNYLLPYTASDDIGATASRITKGWFTNLESTNAPTVNGSSVYYVGGTDVALADGGTNASLSAANGGIVYSTSTALAILAPTATANQVLLSGSSTTPAWSTATYPATTTINQLLYSNAENTITGLATGNNSLLVTGGTGIPSLATDIPTAITIGTKYIYRADGTDVAIADGGTNSSAALTNGKMMVSSAGAIIEGTPTVVGGALGAITTIGMNGDLTQTTGNKILTEKVQALNANGLSIVEDSAAFGYKIQDNGNSVFGVVANTATYPFHYFITAGAGENIFKYQISDSSSSLYCVNGTTVANQFYPAIIGDQQDSADRISLQLIGTINPLIDTSAVACVNIDGRQSDNTTLENRRIINFDNNSVNKAYIDKDGNIGCSKVNAISSSGLLLTEDGGTLGVAIQDTGYLNLYSNAITNWTPVQINATNVSSKGQFIIVDPVNASSSTASVCAMSGWGNNISSGSTGRMWYIGSVSSTNNNFAIINALNGTMLFSTNGATGITIETTGATTFAQNISMTTGKIGYFENITALNANGLKLFEDGGKGITIVDSTGIVCINKSAASFGSVGLTVYGSHATPVNGWSLVTLESSSAYNAADLTRGTAIGFTGLKNASAGLALFASIYGEKENTTLDDQKGYLSFYTNSGSAITERGRINSSGYFGINQTAPLAYLHVKSASAGLDASGVGASDVVIIEHTDAILNLASTEGGSKGSGIALTEINTGALVDKWGIIRETTAGGSSLLFTYGTTADIGGNTEVASITKTGDFNALLSVTTPKVQASSSAGLKLYEDGGVGIFIQDSTAYVGLGTNAPTSPLDVERLGTATANTNILELTNSANAAAMTATKTSILFNQWYYDASTPAVADIGSIGFTTEGNWTSTASTQDSTAVISNVKDGTLTDQIKAYSSGRIEHVNMPFFVVHSGGGYSNKTGDGTVYPVPFPTEIIDRTNSFDTTTGQFTIPITGYYEFDIQINWTGGLAAHTYADVSIYVDGVLTHYFMSEDIGSIGKINDLRTLRLYPYSYTAGQVLDVRFTVSGGTKVIDLLGVWIWSGKMVA